MKNLLWIVTALAACSMKGDSSRLDNVAATQAPAADPEVEEKPDDGDVVSGGAGMAMALDEGKLGKKESARRDAPYKVQRDQVEDLKAEPKAPPPEKPKPGKDANETAESVATRAWFPETFLWQPLVVTDDKGAATVPVRVPDRLTTWHVLALAHTRTGAQGGATASFLGTLPAYVDLVVPPFLIVGDKVRLPIQIVNTTDAPIAQALSVEVQNGTLGPIGGARTVPAAGSLVEYAELTATRAGKIKLRAQLGTTDAVLREIDVLPAGKPVVTDRSGTLAAPRTLSITGPVGSDPTTDRARLVVYPGALALLRSELGVALGRGGVADHAYALLLAGRAPALLAALGDKADPEATRDLAILTGQKVMRDARNLDVMSAMVIVEAAHAHAQNPVMARLGERASALLAKQQRPDGSFSGETGWTLQRLLVATAEGTRAAASDTSSTAAKQRAQGVLAKASGMFERNFARIEDGYTAATVLTSGAIEGALADKLRAKVIESIKGGTDGAKYLEVRSGVVRADGSVPSVAEATAYAVLALRGDPKHGPLLADLGATLLGGYNPYRGWGDGRANLVAMRAVLELFKDPVPADVKITLLMDGKEVTTGTLDRAAQKDTLALEAAAPGIAGTHEWKIVADPPVAGLGYALVLNSWVPWQKETTNQGLELLLPTLVNGAVGKPSEITVSAIAASGQPFQITQALPAGVQIDGPSLTKLVTDGVIEKFEHSDGKLELFVRPLNPGQTFTAKYRVIPTLAGTLHAAASKIQMGDVVFHVQPSDWLVR